MNPRTLKLLVVTVVAVLVVGIVAGMIILGTPSETVLKVYTAGSLAEPFGGMDDGQDMATLFEANHPNVDVQVTSGGSADMIRRVTDLNLTCDVLAVADYSLIPQMMINVTPTKADFVIEFAKNSMILAYTGLSHYKNELNDSNWYEILRRPDVKFGFSNPNDDPCGYRAQMVMILAELFYNDSAIYDDLVMNNTNMIDVVEESGVFTVEVPSSLTVTNTSKVMIRSAEVDLTNALEAGSIDYLFIYESVAMRHASSGEMYLKLPRAINLNDTAYATTYSKVKVKLFADSEDASKTKVVTGKPIVYGITIPSNAEHPDLAIAFLEMVLGIEGQNVMIHAGQEPIAPARAGYWLSAVPEELTELVS